jgi:hypothetical protein
LRRLSAILLLALFCFSPIAPALIADSDANLPACCRRAGKHHCAMTGMAGGQTSSGPAFSSGGRCPYFPNSFAPATNPVPFVSSVSQARLDPLTDRAVVQRSTSAQVPDSFSRSNQKRGPPYYLPFI